MSTTLERLDTAVAGFRTRLDGLTPDALDAPSPCEGWTGADVVDHTITALVAVSDFVGDPVDDDKSAPQLARFDRAAASLHAKVADPALAGTVVESPFGELALKQIVSSIVVHDLLVHTWDLARATGGDEHLDPELVSHTFAHMQPLDETLREHGFGEKVATTDDADEQTQMLRFLGRTP
jgi:uncharacterized protein (TIGR03086 family)